MRCDVDGDILCLLALRLLLFWPACLLYCLLVFASCGSCSILFLWIHTHTHQPCVRIKYIYAIVCVNCEWMNISTKIEGAANATCEQDRKKIQRVIQKGFRCFTMHFTCIDTHTHTHRHRHSRIFARTQRAGKWEIYSRHLPNECFYIYIL